MSTSKVVKRRSRTVAKKTNLIELDERDQTSLNDEVTDSIVQADMEVVGTAAATSVGNVFQSNSQSLSLAALNATNAQQQNNMTAQTTATIGLTTLYSIDIATDTVGIPIIFSQLLKK